MKKYILSFCFLLAACESNPYATADFNGPIHDAATNKNFILQTEDTTAIAAAVEKSSTLEELMPASGVVPNIAEKPDVKTAFVPANYIPGAIPMAATSTPYNTKQKLLSKAQLSSHDFFVLKDQFDFFFNVIEV